MKRQYGWNVYVDGRWIDKVFFNPGMTPKDVKQALIEHDGYDSDITVECEDVEGETRADIAAALRAPITPTKEPTS